MDSLAYLDPLSPLESQEISLLLSKEPRGEIINPFPEISSLKPEPLQALDLTRFKLAYPDSDLSLDWKLALDNAKTCLEYSTNRILELELLSKYGISSWKSKTLFLSQLLVVLESQLMDKRSKIEKINRERKEAQMYISGSLSSWDKKYKNLINSHIQVKAAVLELEERIAKLKSN